MFSGAIWKLKAFFYLKICGGGGDGGGGGDPKSVKSCLGLRLLEMGTIIFLPCLHQGVFHWDKTSEGRESKKLYFPR